MRGPELQLYVQDRVKDYWSPDQRAGRGRRDLPRSPRRWLSRQTIYDGIHNYRTEWQKLLRRRGRPPEKRGKLKDCVRIDGRPEIVNQRCRYGDWEGDTVVGLGRRSALLTMVERKSGDLRLGRGDSLKSEATMRAAKRRMRDLPPSLRRSMTFDNGKEFAEHARLAKLGLNVYFADPYASWQRGTNENTNGLLRQYFPKRTDFAQVSHHAVACVQDKLNERPRRRLGYRTPAEVIEPHLRCN